MCAHALCGKKTPPSAGWSLSEKNLGERREIRQKFRPFFAWIFNNAHMHTRAQPAGKLSKKINQPTKQPTMTDDQTATRATRGLECWELLPRELWELALSNLSLVELVPCLYVCRAWRDIASFMVHTNRYAASPHPPCIRGKRRRCICKIHRHLFLRYCLASGNEALFFWAEKHGWSPTRKLLPTIMLRGSVDQIVDVASRCTAGAYSVTPDRLQRIVKSGQLRRLQASRLATATAPLWQADIVPNTIARFGTVEMMDWVLSWHDNHTELRMLPFEKAVLRGCLPMVQWFEANLKPLPIQHRYDRLITLAVRSGSLDTLLHVLSVGARVPNFTAACLFVGSVLGPDTSRVTERQLRCAVCLGHLEIVQWIFTNTKLEPDIDSGDNEYLQLAIKGGHLPMVKYILSRGFSAPGALIPAYWLWCIKHGQIDLLRLIWTWDVKKAENFDHQRRFLLCAIDRNVPEAVQMILRACREASVGAPSWLYLELANFVRPSYLWGALWGGRAQRDIWRALYSHMHRFAVIGPLKGQPSPSWLCDERFDGDRVVAKALQEQRADVLEWLQSIGKYHPVSTTEI